MKLLGVVADSTKVAPMKRLLAQAGVQGSIWMVNGEGFDSKPSIKQLRQLMPVLDSDLERFGPFDYIMAAGETAARLVLDTSAVNINKLRGRDFDYAYGVRTTKAKDKKADSKGVQGE